MNILNKTFWRGAIAVSVTALFATVYGGVYEKGGFRDHFALLPPLAEQDTTRNQGDTSKLPFPLKSDPNDPYKKVKNNTLDLKTPTAIDRKVELDSSLQYYKITNKVGDEQIGDENFVPFDQYLEEDNKKWMQDYFKRRSLSQSNVISKSIIPKIPLGEGILDNVFGGAVDIRPTGSAELIFAGDFNRIQNPSWSIREQRSRQFKFDQKIQVNVIGNIADRIKLGINYDTQSSFDFENQRKLNYVGKEDEIIKSIELGDVSMPVPNSLISGSQSLFGVKTQLQFGKLFVTGVYSQQRGERKEINVEGGAQRTPFNITADNYDVNRHFFLSQYFRDHYNAFNLNYPSLSNIQITRVEVWITNPQQQVQNTRNILAFMDLGENKPYNKQLIQPTAGRELPDNQTNNLYSIITSNPAYRRIKTATAELDRLKAQNFYEAQDYQRIDNARQLSPTEFSYHPRLGYVSLNQSLNGAEVLAVAYEYTINGQKFQVGEFAREVPTDPGNPNVIFLKMLKSVSTRPDLPIWDLMMKNIYSLNAFQVQPTDFRLQVVYEDNRSGSYLNYIPSPEEPINGMPLVRVLGMDRFNTLGEPKPDGNFDYLEGVTINSTNGRIIFPVLEPFGEDLRAKFNDKVRANYFTYDSLYSSTRAVAIQQTAKNKFYLRGYYQGASGTDISLNAINVPQGSVRVFAGGQELRENADYTVDYAIGRVKIINQSIINSGSVIKVQLESNSLFSIQQKTLMGTRAEYRFNKDFNLGGTIMYLRERPLTPKVNIGDEPIRNAIWGLDGNYSTDSRLLTQLVDKIPFIETKEKSTLSLKGEFAQILPGHPQVLNDPNDINKGGVSYLDDFEGSEVPLPMVRFSDWHLASTPGGEGTRFPESALNDDPRYNFNRAKIAWYNIDPLFFRNNNSLMPNHIKTDLVMQSNHYMREVLETEVYPSKQLPNGIPGTLSTLDIAYFPTERGHYNYNIDELTVDGKLSSPEKRWAGIMRRIETSDFEAANIEYMEFWLMDPFIYKSGKEGGEMFINLGNISEDVLKDGRKLWENGLPKTDAGQGVDTTKWGRVPNGMQITNAFDNEPDARKYQDVGYDGLGPVDTDDDERNFLRNAYLDPLASKLGAQSQAYINANNDPSGDNFHFYTGNDLDQARANIIQRYMNYNNAQGNTPVSSGSNTVYGTTVPDDEDINRDFTLNTTEEFFEYRIKLDSASLQEKGKNYIADIQTRLVTLKNGNRVPVKWYQFKVPVRNYDRKVGPIHDFRSIRFMRLYLTGFKDTVICRFAQLQLIRAEWRSYLFSLKKPGEHIPQDPSNTTFTVSTVNLEENGNRQPPYVLPPGIQRVVDPTTPDLIQQNEQSLSLKVCGLEDGDARGVFKNTNADIRLYKRLRMFVHAEGDGLKNGDMSIFIRLGNDLNNNFYEFEKKLTVTERGEKSKDKIWPAENNIDLLLEYLYNAKLERIKQGISQLVPFTMDVEGGRVTILGNPDIGHVRSILVGVRNPKGDGPVTPICGEVWINELRVTEFDEQNGWAANVMARAKLADFGLVTVSGTRRTIGFGGIEQSLQQRNQKDTRGYDVSTALELGKFFPQRYNIKIPMYYSYSELIHRPRFNPLSPDLPFDRLLSAYNEKPTLQDSVRKANEDFTGRTSLNFTNVQKLRGPDQKKMHIYDIENFYVTYAYSEIFRRNIERVYDIDQNYKAIIGYSYNFAPKTIQPFKKLGSNKYLQLISDFNLYYLPQSIAFTLQGDRRFGEILYRNTDDVKTIIVPQFDKLFKIGRTYDLRYNFSKSLRFSYSALGNSRIPEPLGRIDTEAKRDSLRASILSLGVLNDFSQNTNVSYDVPIGKLPFMDWATLQTTYAGTYTWLTAPLAQPTLGNTISNSQTLGANTQLNLTTLYSKSSFLRNILQNRSSLDEIRKQRQEEKEKNKNVKGKKPVRDTVQKASVGSLAIAEGAARVLMSLRSISGSYTQTDGTVLPGFQPTPKYIGLDPRSGNAPGLKYVFGIQEPKDVFQDRVINEGWLSRDTNLTALYLIKHNVSINGQAVLEPIKGMRINLDIFKKEDQTSQENFRYTSANALNPEKLTPLSTGSYSMSFISIRTAFARDGADDLSPIFKQFEDNRRTIADRIGNETNDNNLNPIGNQRDTVTNYPLGFSKTSQEVLVRSFIAAYSGKDASKISLSDRPGIPLPNWRINYTGLSNIPFIQRFTKNVNINHGYRSTYTVGNYVTSINRDLNVPMGKNLEPLQRIDNITISEDFSPLIGFDISWINNWTSRIEYKKQRVLSFAFSNYQLSEVRSEEFVIGAGYRTNKLRLPFKINRKVTYLQNDFTFRLDFAIRDNKSIIRILDEQRAQSSAGQKVISIRPTIDYVLSKALVLRLFYTQNITQPHISTQYPTSQVNFGFSLRYTLTP